MNMKRILILCAAVIALVAGSANQGQAQGAPPTAPTWKRFSDSVYGLRLGGQTNDTSRMFRRGPASTDTMGVEQSSPSTNEWYRFYNLIFPHDSQTNTGLAPPPHYYQAYLGYNSTRQRWEPVANPWLRISPNTGDDNVAALYWYPYDTLNQIIGATDFEIALDTSQDAFIIRSGTDTIKFGDPITKVATLVATDSVIVKGTGSGQLQLSGSSSGVITVTTQTDAGTYTITVPSTGPLALGADTLCWGYDNSSTGGWAWYPCGNSSGGGGGGAAGPWNANANTTSNSLMYFGGSSTDTAFTVRDSTTDNVKTTVTSGENPWLQVHGKDSTTIGKTPGFIVLDSCIVLNGDTICDLVGANMVLTGDSLGSSGGGGGSGDLTAFGSDLTGDVLADSAGAHAVWFGSGTNRGFSISNTGDWDRWRLSEHLIIGDTSGVQARLGTSPSLVIATDSQNVSIHGGIFHNNASVNTGTGVSWTVSGAAGYDPLIAVTNRTGSGYGFYREYGTADAGDLFWTQFSSASFPYTTSSGSYFWKVESDLSSMTFRPYSFVNFNFNADSGLVIYRDTTNDTTKVFAPTGTLLLGQNAKAPIMPWGIKLAGDSIYSFKGMTQFEVLPARTLNGAGDGGLFTPGYGPFFGSYAGDSTEKWILYADISTSGACQDTVNFYVDIDFRHALDSLTLYTSTTNSGDSMVWLNFRGPKFGATNVNRDSTYATGLAARFHPATGGTGYITVTRTTVAAAALGTSSTILPAGRYWTRLIIEMAATGSTPKVERIEYHWRKRG